MRVLGLIGADVVDLELPVGLADTAFDADGALLAVEQDTALEELVLALRERVAQREPLRLAMPTPA